MKVLKLGCGTGDMNEALYYGVPMVVIPLSTDQPIVADRVTELNLGIRLQYNKMSSDTLKLAAGAVLANKSIKESVIAMSNHMKSYNGNKDIIRYLKRSNVLTNDQLK